MKPKKWAVMKLIEEWKDVPSFEGKYQVSNMGRVRRKLKDGYAIRKPYPVKNGYLMFDFYDKPRKTKRLIVHRVIAEVFVDNPNNLSEVDHIDRNPANNAASNLRWVSHIENMRNWKHNHCLTVNGITKPFSQWSEETGISYSTIKHRKTRLGWNDYDCIFKPVRRKKQIAESEG